MNSEHKATAWEQRGAVGIIWLNRPHRANAWTGRMDTEYRALLAAADADDSVRGIVVTGVGERFCVGGDSEALSGHVTKGGYDRGLADDAAEPGYGVAEEFDAPFACHFGLSKPIVAAVNGAAAGIGMALAAFCDLRFASIGAKFTTAHGKLGLPAEYGLSWILPRLMGTGRAMDVLLTSRVMLAEEALTAGLVNRVVPAPDLVDETVAYLDDLIRTVSGESLRATRTQIYRDLHRSAAESVSESVDLMDDHMRHPDYREGVQAFIEKRPPEFT